MESLALLEELKKTIEAGSYLAAPNTLTQGPALQREDLSPVMKNVTYTEEHIKLQKEAKTSSAKTLTYQFNRQLSYGIWGASAQTEGAVGQFEDSDFVRVTVPMCFYSHLRRVTDAAVMVETFDGVKNDERAAKDAALKLAGDIEFDSFRGAADFSNAGVFDGNLLAIPAVHPNMRGVDIQIRSSDALTQTQDLMFAEFGSQLSVVVAGGGTMSQVMLENCSVRSQMNLGHANKMLVDPLVASAYNQLGINANTERFVAGQQISMTGTDLRRQSTFGQTVTVEASRFLSGKFQPQRTRSAAPGVPSISLAQSAGSTTFANGAVYNYYVTGVNELGESVATASSSITLSGAGNYIDITITAGSGTTRYYNVYRTNAGAAASTARFIGRVASAGTTTHFIDLNNRLPGGISGFLIQADTWEFKELSPYSRKKIAIQDLSTAEAHYRFITLAGYEPRKNVLLDNLIGAL